MKEKLKENIQKVVKNPKRLFRGLNRLYFKKFFFSPWNTDGTDVFEEDWDNLIILDACRYDLFEEKVETEDFADYERKESRGSSSYEYLKANFFGKDLSDTVYLTANGHIFWMEDELDEEINLHHKVMLESGDDEVGFPASSVREQVEKELDKYDDKRLVIHFMQPHYPFIDYPQVPNSESNFWGSVFDGEVDATDEELWEGYSQNFDKVWPEIEKLLVKLEGKTVVTSDHGNMFGERAFPFPIREYGHPQGIYTEELVKAPWLVANSGDRKNIRKEETESSEDYDEEKIKDQLADLGYGG